MDECLSLEFDKKISILKKISGLTLDFRKIFQNKIEQTRRSYGITFDDGYADNFDIALPILQKHSMKATFFIASGYLNGGWMWNDGIIEAISKTSRNCLDLTTLGCEKYQLNTNEEKRSCIEDLISKNKYINSGKRTELAKRILDNAGVPEPKHLMMTDEQIKKLHKMGMGIGGHTVNHPILKSVDKATARREINENKEFLESLIGEPLHIFAYPNGKPGKDYGPEHVSLVKEAGYKCAVTTAWGRVNINTDPFQLPRFTPWDKNPWKFVVRLHFQKIGGNEFV